MRDAQGGVGPMRGRGAVIRFLCTLCALAAPAVGHSRAVAYGAVVHDPFLEELRTGVFREPDDVSVSGGWPADLLHPLALDLAWRDGLDACLGAQGITADSSRAGALLIPASLGSDAALAAWVASARATRDTLVATAEGRWLAAPQPGSHAWLAAPRLMLMASRLWEDGNAAAAAACAWRLVAARDVLGLSSEEAFVWDLRARCLAQRAQAPVALDVVWPLLPDLGLFDVRSGWALWVACRRATGQPLVPPGEATPALGLALASGGEAWLTAAQLRAAGFPPEVEAGLGALVLPAADLASHFARFPKPPTDGLLQGYWLRGQRRRQSGDGAWYESLAGLPGLKDGHRLDMWRRASEARLLAGAWPQALADLAQGLALIGSDASWSMQRKLRSWAVQMLVLAEARKRPHDAQRVLTLAHDRLTGTQAEAFAEEAAPWLARLDPAQAPDPPATRRDAARARVIAGEAPDLNLPEPGPIDMTLPSAAAWCDTLLGDWAALGQHLELPGTTARDAAYRLALAGVAGAAGHRYRTACQAIGAYLATDPDAEGLRRWVLAGDVGAAAGDGALPEASPVPALVAASRGSEGQALARRHALLGLAIVTGDARGQIAAAVTLPLSRVTEDRQLRLEYPVPSAASIREALGEAEVGPALLLAIARNESLFEPADRSRAGALGYMQIMPIHFGEEARLPGAQHWSQAATSLRKGDALLAAERVRFAGDPYRAVAAYNAGAGAVARWDRQLGGVSDRAIFQAWIGYDETRRYVAAVLTDREIYRWLLAR